LSYVAATSQAEVSVACKTVAQAASATSMASCDQATFACNAGTSALPWDKNYRRKTQKKQVSMEEAIGIRAESLPLSID
jgi:hypothetical protein